MPHMTVAVPAGTYVARLLDGSRLPVIGLDRDGRALVLDARGTLTSVASLGALLVDVAPAEPVPTPAPAAPRPARAARPAREPEPVAEGEPEADDTPQENPWLALREQARVRNHLTAVD